LLRRFAPRNDEKTSSFDAAPRKNHPNIGLARPVCVL
jgi:hypothetical protein